MITYEDAVTFVRNYFHEEDAEKRISDSEFAYRVNTQPKQGFTFGNGPLLILKDTGEVFAFSSSPKHEFGYGTSRKGINRTHTAEEFKEALALLVSAGDHAAMNPIAVIHKQ